MIRKHIESIVVIAILIVSFGGVAAAHASTLPTEGHPYRPHVSKPMPASAVPCKYEDGSSGPLPCYWDAAHVGNHVGNSFWVDRARRFHYENDRLDFAETMTRRGWHRAIAPINGHKLCFVKVEPREIARCFDGYYISA